MALMEEGLKAELGALHCARWPVQKSKAPACTAAFKNVAGVLMMHKAALLDTSTAISERSSPAGLQCNLAEQGSNECT